MKNTQLAMTIGALTLTTLLLTGCSSVSIVESANESQTLNTMLLSCDEPFQLTEDCTDSFLAKRVITIDDFEIKVAGSTDGKTIMVMDASQITNELKDPLTLNSKTHSEASNKSFHLVNKFLIQQGIEVINVRALKSLGSVDGYILELSREGYSTLKNLSSTKL